MLGLHILPRYLSIEYKLHNLVILVDTRHFKVFSLNKWISVFKAKLQFNVGKQKCLKTERILIITNFALDDCTRGLRLIASCNKKRRIAITNYHR